MKAIYFLCVFFFFTTALTAQYEKGNWYLDGSSSTLLSSPLGSSQLKTSFNAQSLQAGYFFTDRLLGGSRVQVSGYFDENIFDGRFDIELQPFARYYFPGGEKRKVSYFGEVGLGTISPLIGNRFFEANFHLAGGAEIELLPGVVGTALFRHDANASGLNVTSLTFALNLLLGQLESADSKAVVNAGSFTTTGSFGGLYFGGRGFTSESNQIGGAYLNPSIGYFLADGLMAGAKFSTSYLRFQNTQSLGGGATSVRKDNTLNTSLELNLRYYLKKTGSLLPYITGGAGYQTSRSKTGDVSLDERTSKRDAFLYQVGVGASSFLSPSVALDGSLRYRSQEFENSNSSSVIQQNTIRMEAGLRFFLAR